MGANPGPSQRGPTFSPDGMWWWDGTQWHAAISPDRMWRWNGQAWVPNRPASASGVGAAGAVLVAVVTFGGVILLVTMVTLVILLTMGHQIANVFSNVVAALGSP